MIRKLSMSKAVERGTVEWHEENIKALDESIEHWCRLRDLKQKEGERPNSEWCACCKLDEMRKKASPRDFPDACNGCPVNDFNNDDGCFMTPFLNALDAWYRSKMASNVKTRNRELMQAEVDFLKEVRQSEQRKLENLQGLDEQVADELARHKEKQDEQ